LASIYSILQLIGQTDYNAFAFPTYIQAACLISIIPLLVIFAFTQRFFTEGIERTGIVG
jgi:multiple sugar transport system permease protein